MTDVKKVQERETEYGRIKRENLLELSFQIKKYQLNRPTFQPIIVKFQICRNKREDPKHVWRRKKDPMP